MNTSQIISIDPANSVDILGITVTPLVTTKDTDGLFGVHEVIVPPGAGIPPHTHPFVEFFFAIEGELTLLLERDGEVHPVTLNANQAGLVPPNALHGFTNSSNKPARLLINSTADLEGFFQEAGIPTASATHLPPSMDDVRRVLAIAQKHGQVFPQLPA